MLLDNVGCSYTLLRVHCGAECGLIFLDAVRVFGAALHRENLCLLRNNGSLMADMMKR